MGERGSCLFFLFSTLFSLFSPTHHIHIRRPRHPPLPQRLERVQHAPHILDAAAQGFGVVIFGPGRERHTVDVVVPCRRAAPLPRLCRGGHLVGGAASVQGARLAFDAQLGQGGGVRVGGGGVRSVRGRVGGVAVVVVVVVVRRQQGAGAAGVGGGVIVAVGRASGRAVAEVVVHDGGWVGRIGGG